MAKIGFPGGSSVVYHLNLDILVKIPRDTTDEFQDHAKEQAIFDIIESHERHANIAVSFHRVQFGTFLEYAGDNLSIILQKYQTREPDRIFHVLAVSKTDYPLHWRAEVSGACAWLEKIGLAHCDLRPENIVIKGDHAKVIDFDHSVQVGSPLDLGTEPYARSLADGSYGIAGPVTEQFAMGSILYCLTRGHQPYEKEWWGTDNFIRMADKLRKGEFPALETNQWDMIIGNCWAGKFESVEKLHTEIESLVGPFESTPLMEQSTFDERRALCVRAVEEGLVTELVEQLANNPY